MYHILLNEENVRILRFVCNHYAIKRYLVACIVEAPKISKFLMLTIHRHLLPVLVGDPLSWSLPKRLNLNPNILFGRSPEPACRKSIWQCPYLISC